MRSLSLIVIVAVSFGTLALSGCSSCMPPAEEKTVKEEPPAVTCGPGTVARGTQCVGAVR